MRKEEHFSSAEILVYVEHLCMKDEISIIDVFPLLHMEGYEYK